MTEDNPESDVEDFSADARLTDEPIDAATKDRLAEVARLLALNIGYCSGRKQHGVAHFHHEVQSALALIPWQAPLGQSAQGAFSWKCSTMWSEKTRTRRER